MDPESAKIVYQEYNKVFRTGVPGKNIIYEIIRKNDGQRRVIEDSVSLIRNAEGIITGFRTVSRDITERIKKEKQLIEHRSRLEAIFRSVKDAIITVDPELKIIEVNNSARIICGIASIEVPKQTFSQCFNQCNKSCYEILKQTLENKKTIQEYRIECGHQKRHQQLVSVTSSPLLDPNGKFMGAVLVIKDLTLIRDLERELRERHQFQNIIGRSKKMQDIYRLLEDLADLDTTVLISGESGTGKELVARALHYSGRRAFKPFVTVNCSALAESLLESELFGHVKGAFTGAIKDKEGRFQAANGGTIFLDEIGDISPLIQLKLLRVLQEKVFERVGESVPRKVDVRVIASTNKDLKEKVKKGEFREDLYYRLKVVEIYLPPLRERLEDIPLLVEHFINFFNQRFKKKIEGISNEVLNKFMNYLWPGNIRELEHVIEHAFVLCHGRVITNDHLPLEIRSYAGPEKFVEPKGHLKDRRTAQDILNALNRTGWNKAKAARLLRISRQTVYRKISQYKLTENM
jgi:PAS domain S-box-containing protein